VGGRTQGKPIYLRKLVIYRSVYAVSDNAVIGGGWVSDSRKTHNALYNDTLYSVSISKRVTVCHIITIGAAMVAVSFIVYAIA